MIKELACEVSNVLITTTGKSKDALIMAIPLREAPLREQCQRCRQMHR